jgi:hypothetical protein
MPGCGSVQSGPQASTASALLAYPTPRHALHNERFRATAAVGRCDRALDIGARSKRSRPVWPWLGSRQDRLGQAPCLPGRPARAEGLPGREQALHDQREVVGQLGRVVAAESAGQLADALADPGLARDRVVVRGQLRVGNSASVIIIAQPRNRSESISAKTTSKIARIWSRGSDPPPAAAAPTISLRSWSACSTYAAIRSSLEPAGWQGYKRAAPAA